MASEAEQAFSDIAYSFLQASGININEYMIGFEIAHQNEKGTKMIGMFALKIANVYYYVPVFFNNGLIKPMIMMFNKSDNQFMNLDNDWIEFLSNRPMPSLGMGKKMPENIQLDRNLHDFFLPPYGAKTAELIFPKILEKASSLGKVAFGKLIKGNKQLLHGIVEAYGWNTIKSAMETMQPIPKPKIKGREIILINDMCKQAARLTLKDKIKLQKNGYVIIDNRDQKKLIKSAETIEGCGASSAHEACEVDLMTNEGKRRIVLFPDFIGFDNVQRSSFCLYLDKKSKRFAIESSIDIIYPEESKTDIDIDMDGSINVSKMKQNKQYLIYGKCRKDSWKALEPVFIDQKTKDADGDIFFKTRCSNTIILKSEGSMDFLGKDLIIPDHFRAIEVDGGAPSILGVRSVYMGLNYTRDFVDYHASPHDTELYKNSCFLHKWDNAQPGEPVVFMMKYFNLTKEGAEYIHKNPGRHWIKRSFDISQPLAPGYDYSVFPGGADAYKVETDQVSNVQSGPLQYTHNDINQEIQKAIQLSESGAKEVFDKALIGVLSKITDISSEIRSFLPEYTKCIDKLGRNLFLFWAKPEDVRDKYNINDFSEIEILLSDTFKNLGSIALDIRRKFE